MKCSWERKRTINFFSLIVEASVSYLTTTFPRSCRFLYLWHNNTHRHLSALAVILDMNVLIGGTLAPGVTGVAEAARLIDLAVASEGLVVVGADLATRIDLRVADLHANALGHALFRALKFKRHIHSAHVHRERERENLLATSYVCLLSCERTTNLANATSSAVLFYARVLEQ